MVPTRRQFVGLAGAVAAGAAGCLDQKAEFLVTDTRIIHQKGQVYYDYPEDISVRVEVDNTTPDRQEGTVVVTLERTDGSADPEVLNSWTKRQHISLSRGTNQREPFVFEDVFDSGNDIDNYQSRARIED